MRRLFSAKEKDPVLRTLQRFATVCFIGAAFAALVSACGSSDATPPANTAGASSSAGAAGAATAGAAGAATAGAPSAGAGGGSAGGGVTLTGDAVKGATLFKAQTLGCNTCHGENAEGSLGPNITGNMTAGIGSWTQQQFHDAVRNSKNRKGAALCTFMIAVQPSAASDQDIADLYAFTKSKDSAVAVTGTYCAPGMCLSSMCSGTAM
jgi:Cytochrome c